MLPLRCDCPKHRTGPDCSQEADQYTLESRCHLALYPDTAECVSTPQVCVSNCNQRGPTAPGSSGRTTRMAGGSGRSSGQAALWPDHPPGEGEASTSEGTLRSSLSGLATTALQLLHLDTQRSLSAAGRRGRSSERPGQAGCEEDELGLIASWRHATPSAQDFATP